MVSSLRGMMDLHLTVENVQNQMQTELTKIPNLSFFSCHHRSMLLQMFKLLVTLDNFSSAVVEFCLLHRDRKQAVEEKKKGKFGQQPGNCSFSLHPECTIKLL